MAITIQLTGGLGNQLFQYTSASNVAATLQTELIIDCRPSERVLGRKADLLSFNLQGEKILSFKDVQPSRQVLDRLFWRHPMLRRASQRKLGTNLCAPINELKIREGDLIRGFFQNYTSYSDFQSRSGTSPFSIKEPCNRFLILSKNFESQAITSIHIRKGDYVTYKSTFGLLTDNYYARANSKLVSEATKGETFIFTDSPDLISNSLRTELGAVEIIGPDQLSPAETIVLMSKSKKLITSNSSFSWWAGALSAGCDIIVPDPWFNNLDPWFQTNGLIPSSWKKSLADWDS
jgi:hypothetical protein